MLVMLEMALIAALWGIAHRQLVGTMRFLTTMNQQGQTQINSSQNADAYKPLAQALSLLETGDPPSNPFVCNATILTSSGPAYFLVTFYQPTDGGSSSGTSNNESWTVTSTQQTVASSDLANWNSNLMPSTFSN
jgi:hypothetical protein